VSNGLPAERLTKVTATKADGSQVSFDALVRIDTPMEANFMASGGILPYVLDHLA
jgi:aconitate hydratase